MEPQWVKTVDDFNGQKTSYFGFILYVYPTYFSDATGICPQHWTICTTTHEQVCWFRSIPNFEYYKIDYMGSVEDGKKAVIDVINKLYSNYFRIS